MRWPLVLLAVSLGGLASCKAPVPSAPPPSDPPTFDEPGEDAPTPAGDKSPAEAAAEPQGCRAGGVAWDGKHEGCLYEVGGCCYASDAAACAAAGCDAGGCQVLETAPAQVHCRATP